MVELEVDALLLSLGPEMPWLTGYTPMPLERLTMLVLGPEGPGQLYIPRLEAPRVIERDDVFSVRPWEEAEDPVALVADQLRAQQARTGRRNARVAVGDRTWARFVFELRDQLPAEMTLERAHPVTGPLRACKEPAEIDALRRAAAAADSVAAQLQNREIPLVGRTE